MVVGLLFWRVGLDDGIHVMQCTKFLEQVGWDLCVVCLFLATFLCMSGLFLVYSNKFVELSKTIVK